jgi:predicted FMN-binding regulatory protein PaiB
VVHAWRKPRTIDDCKQHLANVNEITDIHGKEMWLPWKRSYAAIACIEKLLGTIVGIEIPISHLKGNIKLG